MHHDALSDLLSLVHARSAVAGGFLTGGDWAIRFPPPERVKFFIAARGACWLRIDGEAPIRFGEGDVLLLTAPRAFTIASDLALPPLDAHALFDGAASPVVRVGDREDFFLLGGHVLVDSASGRLLIDNLPPAVHLPAGSAEASALQWLVDQLVSEHRNDRPGAGFAAAQLAQLMFLQILRGYFAGAGAATAGRLRAVSDPRIAPAIRLLHGQPGRAWRLAELAGACAMSRTAFAACFKAVAGVAPLTYLTEWRMHLAERALRESDAPLAALAESLGYASESAFSTAFKRVTGRAPKRYRSAMRRQRSGGGQPAPEAGLLPVRDGQGMPASHLPGR